MGSQSEQISTCTNYEHQKFVNLQCNTLVRWTDGTNNSSTKCLMFQVLFFFKSCKILCKTPFNLFFSEITKKKMKSFDCPKSIRSYEKKYMECQMLGQRVICPIGPANQCIILQTDRFQESD